MDELTQLVERSRAGDTAAFAEIVGRFQDRAVAYATGRLGCSGLAEDAAQEACLEAWLSLHRLREPRAFATWFRRILFKQCDRIRRRPSLRTAPLAAAIDLPGIPNEEGLLAVERAERNDRLDEAVRDLPPKLRTAVLLHYVGDLSLVEIAAFLGVSTSAVKKRLFDGRRRLKQELLDLAVSELRAGRPSRGAAFQAGVMDLLRAARAGDVLAVRTLLRSQPRLATARDPLGNTALIVALNGGRRAVARLLLEAGVRPGYHESAAIGWARRVGRWLDHHSGAVDRESREGMTALGYAAHFGHLAVVDLLLAAGADPNRAVGHPLRVTPLHAALYGGRVAVVGRLLERGADPNCARGGTGSPRDGWTALHYAAAAGSPALVAALFERGGDPARTDASGLRPRDVAAARGHGAVVTLIDHQTAEGRKEKP